MLEAVAMANVSVARRYARALLELAGGEADKVLEELAGVAQLMDESEELSGLLENPAFTREQRLSVVEAVMKAQGGLSEPLANLLRLLVERDRVSVLPDITRLYRELADAKAGRLRGKVVSAQPLPPELLERLGRTLENLTHRNVVLEARVDPKVLGGAAAQVGSVVYDGTLKSQLSELRKLLS